MPKGGTLNPSEFRYDQIATRAATSALGDEKACHPERLNRSIQIAAFQQHIVRAKRRNDENADVSGGQRGANRGNDAHHGEVQRSGDAHAPPVLLAFDPVGHELFATNDGQLLRIARHGHEVPFRPIGVR